MQRILVFPFALAVAACVGVVALPDPLPAQRADSPGAGSGTPSPSATAPRSSEEPRERSYPAGSSQAQIAALREDVRGLSSMVREQNLVIEELQRKNRALEEKLSEYEGALRTSRNQQSGNYATMSQVNRALEEMGENFRRSSRDQRREIVDQVTRQIDELARETQRAMDQLARDVSSGGGRASGGSSAPAPAPPRSAFSDDYPEEGVSYTVQGGDTLSSIASRFDSRVRDIINANRLEDPDRLRVGQTLFLPQRD